MTQARTANRGRSKWNDPNNPAYWNRLLKDEGLATVKGRVVFKKDRRTGKVTVRETTSHRSSKAQRRGRGAA